ncbi:MAG: DUF2852 domain-containing protein [Gammaproteobacteria bacterium]|nr:DUF2852 domain-containing protein [Gammaproteobacteria bacterium]MCB1924524.1 DUF2852 domain-containing protein [Gammaproteobacteria bacterium]
MSSTNYSASNATHGRCFGGDGPWCRSGHWSGANIAAMVVGFMLFPPLGIAVLVWTLLGRPVQELPGWVRDKWVQFRSGSARSVGESDNVVFNDYQQTQHDRIREIREEIGRRAEAFRAYRADSKRRQDKKEFDDFMANRPDAERHDD